MTGYEGRRTKTDNSGMRRDRELDWATKSISDPVVLATELIEDKVAVAERFRRMRRVITSARRSSIRPERILARVAYIQKSIFISESQ